MAAVDTNIWFEKISNNQRTINRLTNQSQSQYREIMSLLLNGTEISNKSSIQSLTVPPSNPNRNDFIIGVQQQTINLLTKYVSQQNFILDEIRKLIFKPDLDESTDIFDADWYKALLMQYSYFITRDQRQTQKIQDLENKVKSAAIKHETDIKRIKSLQSQCSSYRAIINRLPEAVIKEENEDYVELEEGELLNPPWNDTDEDYTKS